MNYLGLLTSLTDKGDAVEVNAADYRRVETDLSTSVPAPDKAVTFPSPLTAWSKVKALGLFDRPEGGQPLHVLELLGPRVPSLGEPFVIQPDRIVGVFLQRALGRHCVLLLWETTCPSMGPVLQHASCFVISRGDSWWLVTAGHILKDIDTARDSGCQIGGWKLLDGIGGGAKFTGPAAATIPFDLDGARRETAYIEDVGLDYALIELGPLAQAGLTANGVRPIAESTWQNDSILLFDAYFMLGVPLSGFVQDGAQLRRADTLIQIERIDDPPPELKKLRNRLYGKILAPAEQIAHIGGMSGCPIFGIKSDQGTPIYRALAIQSGWLPNSRIIAACPVAPIVKDLRSRLD